MNLLPTWSPSDQLIHIGTMSAGDKGVRGDSYEGHGISVSECPEAWESIAKLGGQPWWTLTLPGNAAPVFLDWHRVAADVRDEIIAWASANGLCVPCTCFEVSWSECIEPDEVERVFSTYEDKADAVLEFEGAVAEYEGDPESAPSLREYDAWKLTPAALATLFRRRAELDETPLMAALLYAERETNLTGVYWADRLDPMSYSAPRAVIFPDRLGKFSVAPYGAAIEPAPVAIDLAVPFAPRFFKDGGGQWYEDGRVHGAVDFTDIPGGGRALLISEWSSTVHGQGHTVEALEWLRTQFAVITANGVGTVDDGVGDISTYYWAHMKRRGLVDELIDDNGAYLDVGPDSVSVRPPPTEMKRKRPRP